MKGPSNGVLTNWLLGALLVVSITLGSLLFGMLTNRLDRLEDKIDRVQAQYSKIDVVLYRVDQLQQDVDKLKER